MRMNVVPVLLGLALLAGCGGGADLESDDPSGYEACALLTEAVQIDDDPLARIGGLFEVSERAQEATTDAIREAATDTGVVDSDAMAEACEANGVEVP